jgi:DNA mismatch repair protein MutL
LGKFSAVPSIDFDTVDMPDIPAFEQAAPVESPKVHYNSDYNPFKSSASYSRPSVKWENLYGGLQKADTHIEPDTTDHFSDVAHTESAETGSVFSSAFNNTDHALRKPISTCRLKGATF